MIVNVTDLTEGWKSETFLAPSEFDLTAYESRLPLDRIIDMSECPYDDNLIEVHIYGFGNRKYIGTYMDEEPKHS
jgi:hypothetical protein